MVKICPIMSHRNNYSRIWCEEESCALWNENKQCCVISAMVLDKITDAAPEEDK